MESDIRNLRADTANDLSLSYLAGSLFARSAQSDDLQIRIVNLAGQTFMNVPVMLNSGYAEISVSQLPAGVYIASITDKHGQKASCKFIISTTQLR